MYHMFLLSIIRARPSPTIFASTQPNYLHIYRISCKITKKERRERSLPCYDSHGLIQHVKRIYNNNNNNNEDDQDDPRALLLEFDPQGYNPVYR